MIRADDSQTCPFPKGKKYSVHCSFGEHLGNAAWDHCFKEINGMSEKETNMPNSNKPTVNEETLKMSEEMQKKLQFSKDTQSIDVKGEKDDLYAQLRPEDLSEETIKKVHGYNVAFVAASAHAIGHMAVEAMKSDKKLDKVGGTIKMAGKDRVSIETSRAFTPPPRDGQAQPDVAGVTSIKLHTEAANKGAGQLKRSVDDIKSLAAVALAGKD